VLSRQRIPERRDCELPPTSRRTVRHPTPSYAMSLLPPEVHAALAQLLRALAASDNAVRSSAEEQLSTDWVQARPDVLLMALVEQIQGSEDPGVSKPACTPLYQFRCCMC